MKTVKVALLLSLLGLVLRSEGFEKRCLELAHVPVGVRVGGRADRGVTEEGLHSLQVACGVEDALTGGVASAVQSRSGASTRSTHYGLKL